MDPFQQTTYQMALFEAGQLTYDELRTTLKETIPLMKAELDAQQEAAKLQQQAEQPAPAPAY